ncbi:MAG: RNA polymerase sigma factor [Acidimicrobiales bacterium]
MTTISCPHPATNPVAATDGHLHRRLLARDRPAYTELYRRHSGAVYRAAKSVIKDPELAEDVTQEVFLEFFRRPEGADLGRGSLQGYLKMVARRRSIDSIRSLNGSRRREVGCGAHAITATSAIDNDPGELIPLLSESAAIQHHLRDAVMRLPDHQREAVELAFYRGQTYRQVATTLGIPEGTAKSRLRAAIGRLGRDLQLRPRWQTALAQ